MADAVVTLDETLFRALKKMQEDDRVDTHLAALEYLSLVIGWLDNVSQALGMTAVHAPESYRIAEGIVRAVERGSRSKKKLPRSRAQSDSGADNE